MYFFFVGCRFTMDLTKLKLLQSRRDVEFLTKKCQCSVCARMFLRTQPTPKPRQPTYTLNIYYYQVRPANWFNPIESTLPTSERPMKLFNCFLLIRLFQDTCSGWWIFYPLLQFVQPCCFLINSFSSFFIQLAKISFKTKLFLIQYFKW